MKSKDNNILVSKRVFGSIGGQNVFLFRIANSSGVYIEVTNYGATWVSAVIPDRHGNPEDVLLGYPDLEGYISDRFYMGKTVGRFANRIKGGCFDIDGITYRLDKNDGENTNHGGADALSGKIFETAVLPNGVGFSVSGPDGEGGFPGAVQIGIKYLLTEDNTVTIRFEGKADKNTYLNLTNHAYFNLSGKENVLDHKLFIPSIKILESDIYHIPTGEISMIKGSAFDFTCPEYLWKKLDFREQRLAMAHGYNQCYVLDKKDRDELSLAAVLFDEFSGRQMNVYTSYPGMILYTGNYLKAEGKGGAQYLPYRGLCLETQYYPDTPHHDRFPSCLIGPGDDYNHTTQYRFCNL